MSDTNLLEETVDFLTSNNLTTKDVLWVGDGVIYFNWDEFHDIAKHTNYNSGFGGNVIVRDLLIVGEDWWMSRDEYDGSEWWRFNKSPGKPDIHIKPKHVKVYNFITSEQLSIDSPLLNSNFKDEEEFKKHLRDYKLNNILDK